MQSCWREVVVPGYWHWYQVFYDPLELRDVKLEAFLVSPCGLGRQPDVAFVAGPIFLLSLQGGFRFVWWAVVLILLLEKPLLFRLCICGRGPLLRRALALVFHVIVQYEGAICFLF